MVTFICAGAWLAMTPHAALAQVRGVVQWGGEEPSPQLLHSASQGYLGVDLTDVDQEKAQALKLKDVRGAIITLIDHDAPAGQIGLKVNDVVIKLNGQAVEGAEQLRRMLREIPAGRNVSLEISRDGNIQTLAVQLADRRVMEHDVWAKIGTGPDVFSQAPGMGILAGGGDAPLPGGFHMPFFGSSLKVGALVEPLTSQMAEYLGVPSGLMVKQVAHKSEAETAGLKAFDVILKVGSDTIATVADWDRSLRSNQGKPVQVTVLRDRKQQTLTLVVDSKHHSMIEFDGVFGDDECPLLVADLDENLAQGVTAEALRNGLASVDLNIDKKQLDELTQQMKELGKNIKIDDFKLDQKQMDALKQQVEQLRENFKIDEFKLDQKQMDELKQQMKELQKTLPDQLKKELEELNIRVSAEAPGRA
jgi:C-terminal processing protease CtpA/Prc